LEAPLVDLVLLGLLVTFFGIQQRSRPQLYFRFWFAGWILVFSSFLAWQMRLLTPHLASLRHGLQLDFLLLGGFAFLLSFLVERGRIAWQVTSASAAAALGCLTIQLSDLTPTVHWTVPVLAAFQMVSAGLVWRLTPPAWKRRRAALLLLAILLSAVMVRVALTDFNHGLEQWLLAEVLLAAAILYAGTGTPRSFASLAGTTGFLVWGLDYPLAHSLQANHHLLHMLYQFWNLPKYAVGLSMTLRIFEGARDDVAGLAERYRELYEDFRLLYKDHPLPMWIFDPQTGLVLSANSAASHTYGYTQDEFLSVRMDQIRACDDPADAQPEASEVAQPQIGQPHACEGAGHRERHRRKDGSRLTVNLTERDILFRGEEACFALAVDVTEREKLNDQLFHRAQHDALTGLPNRLLLEDRIDQCLLRSVREHKKAVLFTMDADRFKLINDSYGHQVGDECLKAIANRLRGRIRSVDTIARTGGEEFTAIIGGIQSNEDAEKVAAMFIRLFDPPLTLPDRELKVTLSVGAAIFPDDGQDADTLRKKSDQALYHAKRLGRNRFAFASQDVCASFDQAMAIEVALREALRCGGFELHFQPVYNTDGAAFHFEALLRMRAENTHVFNPGLFIPIAEECGLIIPIGNWVVREACRWLVEWRRLGGDRISVGVNVSGKQLLQKGFSAFVLDTLREHDLPPTALELELTETSLMSEPVLIRETMAELATMGIRFAIDDFGTGYSSLARLADLPIALLKIDRSFVNQLEASADPDRRTDGIVAAIIHMAQTLKVQVVAEGVEDEAQLNLLLRRGCELFQGFYLERPMSSDQMSAALTEKTSSLHTHPNFCHTRVAVAKRIRRTTQLPVFAAPATVPAAGTGGT
jgi:diguanylate cyclase (GGDEF)-like protein